MIPQGIRINHILKSIPHSLKSAEFPLDKIDLSELEGIQRGIPIFDDGKEVVSLADIAFTTRMLGIIDLFRGCNVGCSHCHRGAVPFAKDLRSILFEDLVRLTDGFKKLSERFGFDVLHGNKYLSIVDDSNPNDYPIRGLTGEHEVSEAIKLLFDKLRIPVAFVTSGWNKNSQAAQKSAQKVADEFTSNPQSLATLYVSVNPFSGIMQNSHNALKSRNLDRANKYREMYTDRLANTILTFFKLFKGAEPKATLVYKHANDFEGNELVGELETKKLYTEIYQKLKSVLGDRLKEAPTLDPEVVTKFDKSHLIEPSGRGRQHFPYRYNLRLQSEFVQEVENWDSMSRAEQKEFLRKYSLKSIDIDGKVYSIFPSTFAHSENDPIELAAQSGIRLNYLNRQNVPNAFSDIEFIGG